MSKSEYMKSESGQEARRIRAAIRKTDLLTRAERDVCMMLANTWLYHRSGPKKYIHPGKRLIAKRARCCERTVVRALNRLKELGVVTAIKHALGGARFATHFVVNSERLLALFDPHGVKEVAAKLVEIAGNMVRAVVGKPAQKRQCDISATLKIRGDKKSPCNKRCGLFYGLDLASSKEWVLSRLSSVVLFDGGSHVATTRS